MFKNPCWNDNKTAARHGSSSIGGNGFPLVPARIWQIVEGNGMHLTAEIKGIDISGLQMDYVVYGGDGLIWSQVWHPFDISICGSPPTWGDLQHSEVDLPEPYPFYKVEITTMFDINANDDGAVKVTSARFTSR